ncbi:MAG: hypothetical protein MZV64_09130 [Ignavibacteriales bacterium]|nr:hypothetical protein [Ignavibacteriales bacterium]
MTFLAFTIFFAFVYEVQAQNVDNKGNEFIMSYPTAFGGETLQLHLTSDVNTESYNPIPC